MANEKGPKNDSEKLGVNGESLPIRENPEAFEVLQQDPIERKKGLEINPELFGNKEAILDDLKKNHVNVKEVKAFGYGGNLISIDLPAIGDFQGKKVNIVITNPSKSHNENNKLQGYLLSLEDLSDILNGIVSYMKSYGVEIDGNFIFEYSDDFEDLHEGGVLNTFLDLLPIMGGKRLMLKGSRMFSRNGNYLLFDSDNIKGYREEYPLLKISDSSIDENIVYPVEGSCYGRFSLHDWNGESQADEIMGKMKELKDADLVLVYRDNDKYRSMARELRKLIKYKYGGKVYCIDIPKGTEEKQLTEQDKKVLTEVLTNCKCVTDHTVSEWTGVETKKIEESLSDKELSDRQNEFLDTVKNLESYYMAKGIDTVYILSSYRNKEQGNFKLLLEHGGFCQREDGTIYYVETPHDQDEEHYNDAKRFRKNLFPHMHVEIIEEDQLIRGENTVENYTMKSHYNFNYSKSKGALAIVDRHFTTACEKFEAEGGSVLSFAGDSIGEEMSKNVGKFLAEKICERGIGKK